MRRSFASVLAVASSDVIEYLSLFVGDFEDVWADLSLPLRGGVIDLVLAWPDAIDPIFSYVQCRGDNNFKRVFHTFQPCYSFSLIFVVGGCHVPGMDCHIFHAKIILADF